MSQENKEFKPLEFIKVEGKTALEEYMEKLKVEIEKHDNNELEKLYAERAGYRCSNDLANLLINLRTAQKDFFKGTPGSLVRMEALERSKALERKIDNFLKERAATKPQPELF